MGTLQVSYSELFSASLKQPFYENGVTGKYIVSPSLDYTIVPTAQCESLLNRLDMIMKINSNKGGFTIWSRTNGMMGANPLLYFKPKTTDSLTFIISLNNPYFLNYNDLQLEGVQDKIYYFNNLVSDATVPRDNLHLSLDATGVGDTDTIKKVSNSYNYVHNVNVAVGTAKLKHVASGFEISPKSHLNENTKAYLSFDLSGFPNGRCEILIGGTSVEKAYHINEKIESPVFAIIECSLDAITLANYRIVENDGSMTPLRPNYTILFKNRQTLWKYTLKLEDNSPLFIEIDELPEPDKTKFLGSLNIVSNDSSVLFKSNVVNDQHFEFISNTELLLKEKYTSGSANDLLTLTLKKYIGDLMKEADVKTNIPYPSARQLNATADPVIYSDVLLNL